MKYMAPVLAIATAGVLLAGFSGNRDGDAPLAVRVAGTAMPLVDAGTLPEGHPPLTWRQPGLPEGHPPLPDRHPPLPEGHPPLPGADPVCPYSGLGQNPMPGSDPGPRADDAPIIST
jgi:hypothetical protein